MPRAPGPHARVLGGPAVAWRGAEGERVADPVTPGVVWLGGHRGGSRVEGVSHVPAGTPNGGDVAAGRGAMALRDTTLEAIQARAVLAMRGAAPAPWGAGATRAAGAGARRACAPQAFRWHGQGLTRAAPLLAAVLRAAEGRARDAVPDRERAAARHARGESEAGPKLARRPPARRDTRPCRCRMSWRRLTRAPARAGAQEGPAGSCWRRPRQDAACDAPRRRAVRAAPRQGCAAAAMQSAEATLLRRRSLLRTTDEETYGSPPEKPMVRAAQRSWLLARR